LPFGRVRSGIEFDFITSLITDCNSKSAGMAIYEALKKRVLHGTSIQLQQGSTIWHNPLHSIILLPTIEATNLTCYNQGNLDTLEFTIESLLHAEFLIHILRACSTLRRIKEGTTRLC
jgi:hypothetical protein